MEEARPKLLLMERVPGAHYQTELSRRLVLWEATDFEGLVSRLEAQRLLWSQKPRRRKNYNEAAARCSRAKRMGRRRLPQSSQQPHGLCCHLHSS